MLTIRSLLEQLPQDDATRHILVSNVPSPMADDDVKALMPGATRWSFTSNTVRTDFVASFPSRAEARHAYNASQGLSYLGSKLAFEYVQLDVAPAMPEECEKCTAASPPLFFSLPPTDQHSTRKMNIDRAVDKLPLMAPPATPWVEQPLPS